MPKTHLKENFQVCFSRSDLSGCGALQSIALSHSRCVPVLGAITWTYATVDAVSVHNFLMRWGESLLSHHWIWFGREISWRGSHTQVTESVCPCKTANPVHCCFGALWSACEIGNSTPSKICIEQMSWTSSKLSMSLSPQWKEVEKILIHHFGAETEGF